MWFIITGSDDARIDEHGLIGPFATEDEASFYANKVFGAYPTPDIDWHVYQADHPVVTAHVRYHTKRD